MPQEEEDKPDEATDEAKDEAKDEAELLEAKTGFKESFCCFKTSHLNERLVTVGIPATRSGFFHPFFVGPCGASRPFFGLRLMGDMSWLRARNSSLRSGDVDVVAAADGSSALWVNDGWSLRLEPG